MKRPYSSRTRPSPVNERGSASVTVLLLFVVFSGLGLAMLHASGVHMKINAFRKVSALLDCASENGLKRGLRDFTAWLEAAGLLAAVPAERVEGLRENPNAAFPLLLNDALGAAFPRVLEESFDGMTWESRAECGLGSLTDMGGYFRIAAGLRIEASGGLLQVSPKRLSVLEGSLGLLAGRLPLPAIPLYIRKNMTDGEKAAFLRENGISFIPKPGRLIRPGLTAADDGVIPDDPGPIVAKALNIGIFSPGDLSPARLREALGLEPSMDPVPDGVYLIRNDLGLGGVFVQGDLDEMVLAINGDAQVIVFRAAGAEWSLEFSPARSRTDFRTPDGSGAYDLVPLPIVLVNGRIESLGGGYVDADGRVEMSFDGETPAVLDGVDLTIVSSDKVAISSHLVLEGVRWQDGIPYVKDSQAQLVVYSSGRDLASGESVEGGIAVAEGAPSDLKLQASLTAASGGFTVEGTGKAVELLGALHADAYAGNGNALAIVRDDRAATGEFPKNAPLTASPQLAFYSLRVLSWKEY
ncbi:MAG: hypothetical protein A2V76_01525 [Candidatus Aminicenantes bacterium RBG_16_63_14]|nr:MAG: hypothetical protein A2V76_01525 [Candidatus Aminicenantes bacterium RBG_16_63_14]OGD25596.1 MAG: hypothetical protein A2V57_05065 [Candidatus Aminicenantes bacterium RBG_19FT_COMBO_65_30]